MPMTRRALLTAVLAVAGLGGCASAPASGPEAPTVLYLVRHAEKAAEPARDPALTPAGVARAQALVEALADRPIRAVYSSQFVRTQATAAPLASRLGLDVTTLEITGPDAIATVRQQARQIATAHPGQEVLVMGHSNTIPPMISELMGEPMDDLEDHEYDSLFVVTIEPGSGAVRVERRRYGAPNPTL